MISALSRQIGQGQWTANTKGSRVWHFKDGLHVEWKAVAQEITELLAKDRITGILRDPDTLADCQPAERTGAANARNHPGKNARH